MMIAGKLVCYVENKKCILKLKWKIVITRFIYLFTEVQIHR